MVQIPCNVEKKGKSLNLPAAIPIPTWRDLIDVLFLTLVAYQLYIWFRGTRALRVLIGLIVLGGVYSLAKLWGLYLTTWAFQILWQVLVILLLILFQSEIRQVLEKVSPLRYLRIRRTPTAGEILESLAEAAFEMAEEKTGALIVLTREDRPFEFIHCSQRIMALPDPALIKSIFNRHSPAHDGAVIIEDNRITHMGCILPLSEKEGLPESYGTRHRAALGLSEKTDAVCLVVSEERAEVETVMGGEFIRWERARSLAAKLRDWMSTPEIPRFSFPVLLKNTLVKNWKIKVTAFLLVSLAWFILSSQQETKTSLIVPIRYTHISQHLRLGPDSDRSARLVVTARRMSLEKINMEEIFARIDLSRLKQGNHRVELSARDIVLPFGVTIDRITPKEARVVLIPENNKPDQAP